MSDPNSDALEAALMRQSALAGWDNEGGAGASGAPIERTAGMDTIRMPPNNAAELGALHVRIIALENLLIALLATVSDRQLEQAREMASYIAPRPGFTLHPLTTRAAAHMLDLVKRACRFSSRKPS